MYSNNIRVYVNEELSDTNIIGHEDMSNSAQDSLFDWSDPIDDGQVKTLSLPYYYVTWYLILSRQRGVILDLTNQL